MRLIDISEFSRWNFYEVDDPTTVRYAILSHVWNKKDDKDGYVPEPTFQILSAVLEHPQTFSAVLGHAKILSELPMFDKLYNFCKTAYDHGYRLVWADMCCIDKSSSAEVSEAIASMFHWYSSADVCYVYLKDVPEAEQALPSPEIAFLSSEWFKRCWTLQELVAPRSLVFLSKDWKTFGTKTSLASHVASVTGIPVDVLIHERSVESVSVAQRMSWAAGRRATRIEDTAYSLMGLFGIRINIMYGEGTYAFVRLQEEILEHIPDTSLLVWGASCDDVSEWGLAPTPAADSLPASPTVSGHLQSVHIQAPSSPVLAHRYLLATSPDDFEGARRGGKLFVGTINERAVAGPSPFRTVPCHMLHMRLPLIPMRTIRYSVGSSPPTAYLALLGCKTSTGESLALLLLQQQSTQGEDGWFIGTQETTSSLVDVRTPSAAIRIVRLKAGDIPESTAATTLDVYGPLSAPRSFGNPSHSQTLHRALAENEGLFRITMPGWCAQALAANGYFLVQNAGPSSQEREGAHTASLALPQDYETCPHVGNDPRLACPFVSEGRQCPDASSELKITIANCESCRRSPAERGIRCLRGHVEVHVPGRSSAVDSAQSPFSREGCKHHVALWELRDGIALKTFTFPMRPILDEYTPLSRANDTRTRSLLITLVLKRMPSAPLEVTRQRDLVLEIGACTQTTSATPASSPVRDSNVVIDSRLLAPLTPLTPLRTSPISDSSGRLHTWTMARTRSNSAADLSISTGTNAAWGGSLRAPDIDRRRSRSVCFAGSSAQPPPPVPPVPILITPAPSSPAMPTQMLPEMPTIRHPAMRRPVPSARLRLPPSPVDASPIAPTSVLRLASAPEQLMLPVAGPSKAPAPGPSRPAPHPDLEEVAVVEVQKGAAKAGGEDGRARRVEPKEYVGLRTRMKRAVVEEMQRVMSIFGRGRRRD